ncbi:MAG: ATP-binding protein [Bryobacteraceae bacterium]
MSTDLAGNPVSAVMSAPPLPGLSPLPNLGMPDPGMALIPPIPETVEETGLSAAFIEQLLLKMLYFRGEMLGRDLATAIALKFSIIEGILEPLKRLQIVQVKRSLGMGNLSGVFALSESGRGYAREHLETNQYTGPAPVPLEQYAFLARRQRLQEGWLSMDRLAKAYNKMVLSPEVLGQIGPAVSSGNSFLIYGQPGNGKTFLAEALVNLDCSYIYLPYAIESQGMIVQLFDPLFHHPVDEAASISAISFEPQHDRRWFKTRRPFIVSGGELTLEMLDLSYNATSKVYDAPFHLKASNGIYLIDDFGRQRCTPAEVLNRWIVPMERRVDYLSFRTGGKMTVPFESFLVFSTNLKPEQLGDEAFLRRIQYKMHLRSPSIEEFLEIFHRFCDSKGLVCPPLLAERFVEKRYLKTGKAFRRCQPRDVLSHAINLIHFEKLPFELTEELLDRAFESCFVQVDESDL